MRSLDLRVNRGGQGLGCRQMQTAHLLSFACLCVETLEIKLISPEGDGEHWHAQHGVFDAALKDPDELRNTRDGDDVPVGPRRAVVIRHVYQFHVAAQSGQKPQLVGISELSNTQRAVLQNSSLRFLKKS